MNHDMLPRPKGTVLPLAEVRTWEAASDYICAAYHACVDKIEKTSGADQERWSVAANGYLGAYMSILGLRTSPGDEGFEKIKALVADANHKAGLAASGGVEKLGHDKLPRPGGRIIAFPRIDTFDEATDYILSAYHACVDKLEKTAGAEERLWASAALAYFGAYMGIAGLKSLPGNTGLATTLVQIADANHKADHAAAATRVS